MRTTTWSAPGVLGRCLAYGALSGAVCGMGILFVLFAVDGGIDSFLTAIAATAVYTPFALVVGGAAGVVDGFVVAVVLVLLGRSTQEHLGGARVITGFVAALPPAALLWSDVGPGLVLGCIAASALGAAYWTPRILGRTVR